MRLPNADRAVVDIEKLRDYCLDTGHFKGQHKARVFKAKFGLTEVYAEFFRESLLAAVQSNEVVEGTADEYGRRYVLDFWFEGPDGEGVVRSSWMVRRGEDFPRLTSCYAL